MGGGLTNRYGTDEVQLSLVILAVADVARSRRFYTTVLPHWRVVVDETVYVELRDPAAGMRLGLYDRASYTVNTVAPVAHPAPPGVVAGTELYFHAEQAWETLERVRDAGGVPLSDLAPRDWGDTAAYFADPDGNVLVIAHPS